MSVIVLAEHAQGNFKKKSFEAVQYAAGVAQALNTTVTAVVLGNAPDANMQQLGQCGAQKVLHVADARLDNLNGRAYSKAIAPRVAARLKAGMVAGAVSQPDLSKGFVIKKNVFSGKAFSFVNISSD